MREVITRILSTCFGIVCIMITPIGWFLYGILMYASKKGILFSHVIPILLIAAIFLVSYLIQINDEKNDLLSKYPKEYDVKNKKLEEEFNAKEKILQNDYAFRNAAINDREEIIQKILTSRTPFKESAQLYADMHTCLYEKSEYYLRYKSHPARNAANEVKAIRKTMNKELAFCKEMYYKYEFLLDTFPELRKYVDDEDALISLGNNTNYEDFRETRDKAMDYLSLEEWKKLSEDERNQLALDRYKKKAKSNWTVGMLYEMYVGYILRDKYQVIQYGIKHGLQDLGRDIIATTYVNGRKHVHIIQCKNWSASKEIHENVVCQLFGTAMEYDIRHNKYGIMTVIPTLYVTTKLSDIAVQFAEKLGVEVHVIPIEDFPLIKCNINNGEKIYHLPFDQQYWRTEIRKPGEFYASTVKEAVSKGFRRAMRHQINGG